MTSAVSASRQSLLALRATVAALLFIHGSYRLLTGGVSGFGEFLTASHLPAGPVLAWIITLMEIVGTVALGLGLLVRPLAVYFALELTAGIVLVHSREGWFVVGGGRNGMEYSILLIALLLAVAWAARREP